MNTQNALQTSPDGRESVRPSVEPDPSHMSAERPAHEPQRLVLEFHNDNGQIKAEVTDLCQPAVGHTLTTCYLPKFGQAFRISSGETWECEVVSQPRACRSGWEVFVQPTKRLRVARSTSAPIADLLRFGGVKKVVVPERPKPAPVVLRSLTDPDFVPEGATGGGRMSAEVAQMLRTPPPARGAAVRQLKKNGQPKGKKGGKKK